MDISVVIPAYNEEGNVRELFDSVSSVLKKLGSYEIIFVDDGSTDNTYAVLSKIRDRCLRIIRFRKNFGQTAAWDAGFKASQGDIIITMDADLQNDPKDIPKLLSKIKEGFDVVSGWRADRKDNFSKRVFSRISSLMRRLVIDSRIHDPGCSLKAYKRSSVKNLNISGEMHRYICEILALRGFKIGEVVVSHHKRKSGSTKYNLVRLPKGFLDLLVVAFWQKYSARPVHLFGGFGIGFFLLGGITGTYLLYEKFFLDRAIGDRPLLLLAVLLVILGIQFIIFGLISDILVKIYYSDRPQYEIEK